MHVARWLVALVALMNFGGVVIDGFVPVTARMHLRNPAWPPHAKFHNAQTMMMGVLFGTLALIILFVPPLTMTTFLVAVATAGIYFWSMLAAEWFPGVAWVDPEFAPNVPKVAGLPQQKFVSIVLTMILVAAVTIALM